MLWAWMPSACIQIFRQIELTHAEIQLYGVSPWNLNYILYGNIIDAYTRKLSILPRPHSWVIRRYGDTYSEGAIFGFPYKMYGWTIGFWTRKKAKITDFRFLKTPPLMLEERELDHATLFRVCVIEYQHIWSGVAIRGQKNRRLCRAFWSKIWKLWSRVTEKYGSTRLRNQNSIHFFVWEDPPPPTYPPTPQQYHP